MPRQRMLDPEQWDDPDFQELPFAGQILFQMHWSLADDEGRGQCDPRRWLKKMWPKTQYVDEDSELRQLSLKEVKRLCSLLGKIREDKPPMIIHYPGATGETLYQCTRWRRYQSVSYPRASVFPPPPDYEKICPGEALKRGRKGKPITPAQADLLRKMCAERGLLVDDFLEQHGYSMETILSREVTLIIQKLEQIEQVGPVPEYRERADQIIRCWKAGDLKAMDLAFASVPENGRVLNGVRNRLLKELGMDDDPELTLAGIHARLKFGKDGA